MELKRFQEGALSKLDRYLDLLVDARSKSEAGRAALESADLEVPPAILDFPLAAWRTAGAEGLLPPRESSRGESTLEEGQFSYEGAVDGIGRPVPSICMKVPTGGGKTLLGVFGATAVLAKYCGANTGLVLWIVPNEAIYSQTLRQLTNREHPYRQALDRAAAGADRVKILEKDAPLAIWDIQQHLCVMVLMLQSAARASQEQLRMFRDRGNVQGFFPDLGDSPAHAALRAEIPNLDIYEGGLPFDVLVKGSLGNVLRLARPIVVIDEGHRAYTPLARQTILGFNPSFLLELTATPRPAANRLVDVSGRDLEAEDMIKLPINVDVRPGDDWKACLGAAFQKLDALASDAERLLEDGGSYIRPILLVQVQRTGRESRDAGLVHALDAVEHLQALGLAADQIALKTSTTNDLRDLGDLLSPTSRIRAIITKQALQEGWDCPFAYVLCSLSSSTSLAAMTQLVGRVLRQPEARKTAIAALNESFVFCHHESTSDVVEAIKQGLEADGMGDLDGRVRSSNGPPPAKRMLKRRESWAHDAIFLPEVIWAGGDEARPLDFDRDVLGSLDYTQVGVAEIAARVSRGTHAAHSTHLRAGLELLSDPTRALLDATASPANMQFDTVYSARVVSEVVGNPWIAYDIVMSYLGALSARGFTQAEIDSSAGYLLDELRRQLLLDQDRLAEAFFRESVAAGTVHFHLRTDALNWQVPFEMETFQPASGPLLYRSSDARPLQKSLFAPMYKDDFNSLEAAFAIYLDEEATLSWWFRNVARSAYGIQGWRRHRVYPDFVFATSGAAGRTISVIETKGDHLQGYDTTYKKNLLSVVSAAFRDRPAQPVGELEVVLQDDYSVSCDLVFGADWKTQLEARHFSEAT